MYARALYFSVPVYAFIQQFIKTSIKQRKACASEAFLAIYEAGSGIRCHAYAAKLLPITNLGVGKDLALQ